MSLRFAELFAGAGGLSLGLERAGLVCVWHCEIEDAPRAILSHHWPQVPLLGDVTTLDGRALVALHGPIDLLSGGSPCQDLSVAGKRAGMAEGSGTRSSLFYEQIRLWNETGADLCLWENVDGARSSNDGKDFGEVLRAFVGTPIPVPSDGWRSAGVAAGPLGVAAWRVLDAQFFGVPQRRRRIFVLGTRTGRVDPAQVLSLAESVRGDSQESGEAREGFADGVDEGIGFQSSQSGVRSVDTFATLDSNYGSRRHNGVLAIDLAQVTNKDNRSQPQPLSPTLNGHGDVIAFGHQNSAAQGASASAKCAPTLDKSKTPAVLSFNWQKGNDIDNPRPSTLNVREDRTDPLRASTVPAICITGPTTHALTSDGSDGSEDGTGRGTPIVADAYRMVAFGEYAEDGTASTIKARDARDARDATDLVVGTMGGEHLRKPGQQEAAQGRIPVTAGIPRRLTPRECERLQNWPDDWTLVPLNGKPLSDSARYRAIGNGVASVHTHWIGWRLMQALGEA